jgi:hypothetical protein
MVKSLAVCYLQNSTLNRSLPVPYEYCVLVFQNKFRIFKVNSKGIGLAAYREVFHRVFLGFMTSCMISISSM